MTFSISDFKKRSFYSLLNSISIYFKNVLNNNLKGFTPVLDETGQITGYKTSVGGADTVFPFFKGAKILKVLGTHSGTYDFRYTATNKCKLICYLSAFFGDAGQTISVQASINGTYIFNKSMVPPAGGGSGYNYSDIKDLNSGDIFYGRVSVPNFGYASHVSMFIAVIN